MTRTWLLILGAFATVGFATLTLVAIPSLMLVQVPHPTELQPYTEQQARGRAVYVANGCIYCHTQQVRDAAFGTDVARGWGARASVPADYVYDKPHLLGTMRTGPDLLNVGARLPDVNWQLAHLYSPRSVTPWSIMPSFRFMFDVRDEKYVDPLAPVVKVSGRDAPPRGSVIVPKPEALALVDYLLSLKRDYPVPPIDSAATVGGRTVHTMP